jgi:hypothetical protein
MPRKRSCTYKNSNLFVIILVLYFSMLIPYQLGTAAEAVSSDYPELGKTTLGFQPIKSGVDGKVSETVGVKGGCLQITLKDGTIATLIIPPSALLEDTEITLTPAHSSDYPDPGDASAGGHFGIDFKPDGLKFFIPAFLKIHYPDSVIEDIAKELGLSTDEAEKKLVIYTFGSEPLLGRDMYSSMRVLERDIENNIMIVEVEHFSSASFGVSIGK